MLDPTDSSTAGKHLKIYSQGIVPRARMDEELYVM